MAFALHSQLAAAEKSASKISQKTRICKSSNEFRLSLVGSEMCIRDRQYPTPISISVMAGSADQSIVKIRRSSSPTVIVTVMASSGSNGSIFSGHSTRQSSPE